MSGPAEASTDPYAADARLRGRTYAIPFQRVWSAALRAAAVPRGWEVLEADDERGVIRARARTWPLRRADELLIRVSLDENGQTRLDATARPLEGSPGGRRRLTRRIARLVQRVDRSLGAEEAGLILDPTRPPVWEVDG